jgi:hypothetical protein
MERTPAELKGTTMEIEACSIEGERVAIPLAGRVEESL